MANFQKCPQGHFYDLDKYPECPVCKSGSGTMLTKIFGAVAVLSVLGAGFLFYNLQETKNVLAENEQRWEKYSELEKIYGRGDDNYYATEPFIILKENGSEGKITVYWNSSDENAAAILTSSRDITAKWVGKFDSKTHVADVVITPGKAGVYPITFSNKLNNVTFQVLVIVK